VRTGWQAGAAAPANGAAAFLLGIHQQICRQDTAALSACQRHDQAGGLSARLAWTAPSQRIVNKSRGLATTKEWRIALMQRQPFLPSRLIMKTTRYKDMDLSGVRQSGLLLMSCAMLAGCGNQGVGNAGRAPGASAPAYLLFPLTFTAPGPGGAGTRDAGDSAAHVARQAAQPENIAPGAEVSSMPGSQAAVARGINQTEQIVGSYSLASGEKRAFLWTASHGMRDLNDLVKDKSSGLTLSDALAISDAGAIIAQGNTGLVLLRPLSRPDGGAAMPSGD
jgi:probable HAF family extracellular repeat protein